MKLDIFDRKILNMIQKNSRRATDGMADQIGLSVSAVQRRLKKLRSEGVIASEIAIVDKKYAQQLMTFIAGIEIERDNYQTLTQFKAWAKGKENIQQIHYVTGTVDLMLVLCAPNVADYDRFMEVMMAEFPAFRRIATNVVLDSPMQSFYTPFIE